MSKAPREVLKVNLMLQKDKWIDENIIDSLLDIIDPLKKGQIDYNCFRDATYKTCSRVFVGVPCVHFWLLI